MDSMTAKGTTCAPGCTCGKHTRSGGRGGVRAKCPPGCTCGRHARVPVIDWSDDEARKAYNRQKATEKYAADPEPLRQAARDYRAKNPGRKGKRTNKDYNAWYMYGITPERMAEMALEQHGLCYLCGEPLDFAKRGAVHVDHDHSCCRGKKSCGSCVRGLACGRCNAGVGHFGDDPDRMRRVADALEMANRRVRQSRPVATEPTEARQ